MTRTVDLDGPLGPNDEWWTLTRRWGAVVRSPADAQLRDALEELFSSRDAEHPNAWLCFGRNGGPTFVVDVYEGGTIQFDEWADTEYERKLVPTRCITRAPLPVALRLWQLLRLGDVAALRTEAWS